MEKAVWLTSQNVEFAVRCMWTLARCLGVLSEKTLLAFLTFSFLFCKMGKILPISEE